MCSPAQPWRYFFSRSFRLRASKIASTHAANSEAEAVRIRASAFAGTGPKRLSAKRRSKSTRALVRAPRHGLARRAPPSAAETWWPSPALSAASDSPDQCVVIVLLYRKRIQTVEICHPPERAARRQPGQVAEDLPYRAQGRRLDIRASHCAQHRADRRHAAERLVAVLGDCKPQALHAERAHMQPT